MKKIHNIAELRQRIEQSTLQQSQNDETIQVKVAMATCGIASGAEDTLKYFVNELKRQKIPATVSQTGCMGYCYAEPTVEITLPGEEAVVFGFVNSAKAQEIIDIYIVNHQLVDGIIPAGYKVV